MLYHTNCIECKNEINLNQNELNVGDHYECPTCGITLEITNIIKNNDICEITESEIVEEEK